MRMLTPMVVIIVLTACGDSNPSNDAKPLDTTDIGPLVPGELSFPDGSSASETNSPMDTATPNDLSGPVQTDASVTPPADVGPTPDGTAPQDTAVAVDGAAPQDTVGPTPVEGCENQGFPALSAGYNDFGDLQILEAYDADLPPFGVLGLEIYDGVMRGPGSREIIEQNYRDCKVCVRIRTGCGFNGCNDFWLAKSGRVVIDSWDTHVTGYLDDLEFTKVTIDPDTNISTPVDGPGWCINRFYFNIQAD